MAGFFSCIFSGCSNGESNGSLVFVYLFDPQVLAFGPALLSRLELGLAMQEPGFVLLGPCRRCRQIILIGGDREGGCTTDGVRR